MPDAEPNHPRRRYEDHADDLGLDPESRRLADDAHRRANWKRWGPYLADRQWGTVREDYSAHGDCWNSFPHEHARSRAYRWGEDGLLGVTDRECRLCLAPALWNGQDDILKERPFGLTNGQGNHGEDVKELYYHLDATPTFSYAKALYKYPHAKFPYDDLLRENARRGVEDREYEVIDTGVFDGGRYFDVTVEYAKGGADDVLMRVTAVNRGPEGSEPAPLWVVPQAWFRNTWAWGCGVEGDGGTGGRPTMEVAGEDAGAACVVADHGTLGRFFLSADATAGGSPPALIFTDNDTNAGRLYGIPPAPGHYPKDAFHNYVCRGEKAVVNPRQTGTKAGAVYKFDVPPGDAGVTVRVRLTSSDVRPADPFGDFDAVFDQREKEADAFYDARMPPAADGPQRDIVRRAYAGLLWTRQFYYYDVDRWIAGDPAMPPPPPERQRHARNKDWRGNLFNCDVLSMPDSWEYPWYAAWDLAFHMIPFARVDPADAKRQCLLMLREWYMHPSGQIPAYEFNFDDVNPPVHAWACWRVYKMTGPRGGRDRAFLARCFQKLLLNFTWWVNRKDVSGKNIFGGGFLGMDNISLFDRSDPRINGDLQQADGTAWMAFYCATMLAMALELAAGGDDEQGRGGGDVAYEDMASKFFEHFIAITDAINTLGDGGEHDLNTPRDREGTGLWDDADGFYYDRLKLNGGGGAESTPIRVRSLVGVVPLFACDVLDQDVIDRLPGFKKRMEWFVANRTELARHITCAETGTATDGGGKRLLAVPSRERLEAVLRYVLDENEFLSPYGVRSLSKYHEEHPFSLKLDGRDFSVRYVPGASRTNLFGGNSNWRGPVWFPLNYLLIEALERYHYFYGDDFTVECPVGSGNRVTLLEAAREIERRLVSIFLPGEGGRRPVHGDEPRAAADPAFGDELLFYEYFNGDDGRGLGASHQTGWTALVANCIERLERDEAHHHRHAERAALLSPPDGARGIERTARSDRRTGLDRRSGDDAGKRRPAGREYRPGEPG